MRYFVSKIIFAPKFRTDGNHVDEMLGFLFFYCFQVTRYSPTRPVPAKKSVNRGVYPKGGCQRVETGGSVEGGLPDPCQKLSSSSSPHKTAISSFPRSVSYKRTLDDWGNFVKDQCILKFWAPIMDPVSYVVSQFSLGRAKSG